MAILPKVNSSSLSKLLFFQKKAFNFSFGRGKGGSLRTGWRRTGRRGAQRKRRRPQALPCMFSLSFFFFSFFPPFSPPSLLLAGSFVQAAFCSLTAAWNISHIRSSAKLCACGHITLRSPVCQLQSASQVMIYLLWGEYEKKGKPGQTHDTSGIKAGSFHLISQKQSGLKKSSEALPPLVTCPLPPGLVASEWKDGGRSAHV